MSRNRDIISNTEVIFISVLFFAVCITFILSEPVREDLQNPIHFNASSEQEQWNKELRCTKSINATVYEDCERTSESQWTISYCTKKVEEICTEKQEFWVRK